MKQCLLPVACVVILWPAVSSAQGALAPVVEVAAGHAGFVDDAMIHHAVVGSSLRWYVTPRVSLGPEIVYMRGPGSDRDLMFTGNLTFDLLRPRADRRWMPFVVAGAGLFRHTARFGSELFSSSEGAFTAGAGARVAIGERWFVGGEWRAGWELHSRINAIVGLRLPR